MVDRSGREFWLGKKVFVTGCTGLLGFWLTKELAAVGAEVTGLVRDWVPKANVISTGLAETINIVRGSLEEHPLLVRAINEYEIDTVFHLGAQAIVGTANRNPLSTFETNIRGTWNLLEACRLCPTVKRVVVASSDKAYGSHDTLPYTEDMSMQGRYPYDVSKSCTDLLTQCYFQTYGVPTAITRCGNFYGGGDLNFNRIIPGTVRSVLAGERPIIRSDGMYIRDYIYIRDVVEAYLLLAESMDKPGVAGEAFNFSNELQLTVLALTEKILTLMGSALTPMILNEAKGEIKHQYLSSAKARRLLGWSPRWQLDQALQETIAWYTDFLERA